MKGWWIGSVVGWGIVLMFQVTSIVLTGRTM